MEPPVYGVGLDAHTDPVVDVSRIDSPLRIFLSAGPYSREGFVSTQQDALDLLVERDWEESFGRRKPSTILAEHVWEHLTPEEGREAARRCFRWMEPGGRMRVAVPDRLFPDEEYQRRVVVGGPGPAADHKVVYDHASLAETFRSAGFSIRLLEWWDEAGVFHHEEWHPEDGLVYRSRQFDARNHGGRLVFTSLILDAAKPLG